MLTAITPAVQVLPPAATQLDLTGALRYHDCTPPELAARVLLRLAALWGITASAGLAGNRMLAAMACAESAPGRITVVGSSPQDALVWLRPRRIAASLRLIVWRDACRELFVQLSDGRGETIVCNTCSANSACRPDRSCGWSHSVRRSR
jgi:hypothetical protein